MTQQKMGVCRIGVTLQVEANSAVGVSQVALPEKRLGVSQKISGLTVRLSGGLRVRTGRED